MTDPIADFLTRIRNAVKANHKVVEAPGSKINKLKIVYLCLLAFVINSLSAHYLSINISHPPNLTSPLTHPYTRTQGHGTHK